VSAQVNAFVLSRSAEAIGDLPPEIGDEKDRAILSHQNSASLEVENLKIFRSLPSGN
jgi:hypothetical protein